jgi:hypothetical protein
LLGAKADESEEIARSQTTLLKIWQALEVENYQEGTLKITWKVGLEEKECRETTYRDPQSTDSFLLLLYLRSGVNRTLTLSAS